RKHTSHKIMSGGVAITGMGIFPAIGNTVEENYNALITKKAAISTIENIFTIHKEVINVGESKLTNSQMEELLGLKPGNNYSRTALLGAVAAKQAVANAGITDINEYNTGLISATSVGGMDMTEKFYHNFRESEENRRYIDAHDAGDSS